MNSKIINLIFASFFSIFFLFNFNSLSAENNQDHQINIFLGNFDFSDDKQSAILVGFQHQNENLNRDTFLGNVSPITGGFVTENSAAYIYTGIEWNVEMGSLTFTPSFAPGLIMREMAKT